MFIACTCCACCCCKCRRRCAFWIWDNWTLKECIRHTRERCCVITNINADRVLYSELPQTPPSTPVRTAPATPVSVRSLPFSLQEPRHSNSRAPEPRRSASRLDEDWGWIVNQKKTKAKERKGER